MSGADERIQSWVLSDHRRGHETRYHLAAGYLELGDVVMDAACGIGYGADILTARGGVRYVGVDRDLGDIGQSRSQLSRNFIQADLGTWTPDFSFDVFVGFETMEHLPDYGAYIAAAKRAHRFILLSVPVVPTVGKNVWHVHDFEPGEVATIVEDHVWQLRQFVAQPTELSETYVFAREA